jgi:hypothetical protein
MRLSRTTFQGNATRQHWATALITVTAGWTDNNNIQFTTPVLHTKLLFAVLCSAGSGTSVAPHLTGNFLAFVSAVSSILHA